MHFGLHHLNIRKRIHSWHDPYPHPDKAIRALDKIVVTGALLGPLVNIPQLLQIYTTQNAGGLSLFTWSSYIFFNIIWLIYGVIHKSRLILVCYSMWAVMNAITVIGILLFS
ncbi:MAG: hypothetical protein JW716_01310 [Candidatus Aenigmarchaeota archaeon]|nr:hypothetical protein [Candidatus Aenigmarchaeota archaeon]